MKKLWIQQIKDYRQARLDQGISPATINRETATLSGIFRVLVDSQKLEINPVKHVKSLSTKGDQREVYLSRALVMEVTSQAPAWFEGVILTAFYTGMRLGEIRSLTHEQVKLSNRMIYLSPQNTKEGHEKRVPVHRELLPALEIAMKVVRFDSNRLFLVSGRHGTREPSEDSFKKPWGRAYKALNLPKPWPTFHDLRHTWKTNARRSGMDPEIRESILGHWFKEKSVTERYGRISDQELVNAIDSMTFDHGESEIYVPKHGAPIHPDQIVTFGKQNPEKRKKAMGPHRLNS
jgi:integrase